MPRCDCDLELLHELITTATVMALLVNPTSRDLAKADSREQQAAAQTLGLQLHILHASTEGDFDAVFASLIQLRASGLVQVGVYTGRILKGEKPAEMPVSQATKVELFINLKTAKALGLIVPTSLLVRADEVIE
jgi:putative tryptophan/tyrosine transport system substrate-binding protein